MTATITNLHEWAERRARRHGLEHLHQWGWLPSDSYALISLMELPVVDRQLGMSSWTDLCLYRSKPLTH